MPLDTTIGGAAADSYATLAEFQSYLSAIGLSGSGVDATDEANLRRARQYMDRSYLWKGTRVTQAQALEWPRFILEYVEGYAVPSDSIPQAIKDAQCEVAYLIQSGADVFATITGGAVKRKREKVDVIEEETEYSVARDRDAYPAVDMLVAPYAEAKSGQTSLTMGVMRR